MLEIETLLEGIEDTSGKEPLIGYITSQFYKAVNDKESDQRRLLLLVAAISMLNIEGDAAQTAAKKLAQMSTSKKK